MVPFIISLILLIITVGAIIVRFGAKNDDDNELAVGATVVAVIAGLITSILLFASMTVIVPTRQVGIPVTFGVTGQPMPNGFSFKAPWTKVELMDTTIQIDDNLGDKRTEVRLGNQNVAFVQNQVRWSVKPESASDLFNLHKSFEKIGPAIEEPEIASALSSVLSTYDPMDPSRKSNEQIADEVKTKMNDALGDRLVIHEVKVIKIDFDQLTQGRLDALLAEQGNTRIAEQKKQTATKEAEANKILSDSIKNDPNVLVANCIKAVETSKPGTFPAGFQCWSGTGGSVVIPSGN